MTSKEGSDFLEEVSSNLVQLQLRYGLEKQMTKSLGLKEAHASNEIPHQGEIVVTSYKNPHVDTNLPVQSHQVLTILFCD